MKMRDRAGAAVINYIPNATQDLVTPTSVRNESIVDIEANQW